MAGEFNATLNTREANGTSAHTFLIVDVAKYSRPIMTEETGYLSVGSEFESLLSEGYVALAKEHLAFAEEGIHLVQEILPEWK
jgi:hypothetical protein